MSRRQARGRAAEELARRHLEAAGLRLRTANYRCRCGEIDLVMESRSGDIVFVEVRYRARNDYGGAVASVDAHKRRRLVRAATLYIAEQGLDRAPARFDVVAVDGGDRVEWLPGAFDAGE